MKLTLMRTWPDAACTIGQLFVNGVVECYTLEDVVRPPGAPKVFGQTAIPTGTYSVVIDHSAHFGRDLPHVLNVPGFEGIRIHPGNVSADTEGCILVGTDRLHDSIGHSRVAFDALFAKMQAAIARGESITLDVV